MKTSKTRIKKKEEKSGKIRKKNSEKKTKKFETDWKISKFEIRKTFKQKNQKIRGEICLAERIKVSLATFTS